MKKSMFMLITMALLGTTSITHAAGCSDGSEPVRTISSDGSYFVFKCGVSNKQTSSSKTNTNVGPVSINVHDEYLYNNFSGLVSLDFAYGIRTAWFGYVQIPLIDVNDDGHKDLIFNSDPPYTLTKDITQNSANLVISPWSEEWQEYDMFDTVQSPNTTFGTGHTNQVADFNGDGRMDMVVEVSDVADKGDYLYGGIVLLTNTGKGIFTPKNISKKNATHNHSIGDLDGDGDIDIIYHQLGEKNITCAYNDGKANFTVKSCLRTPIDTIQGFVQNIWGLRIADFDNDGFNDVFVIASHGSKRTTFFQHQYRTHELKNPGIFWGNGSGQFSWNDMTFIDLSEWNDKAFDNGEVYFTGGGASQTTVDIGKDGDVDIALNLLSKWTIGSAVVLVENLGNREFTTKEITRSKYLKEDPKRFRTFQDKHTQANTPVWTHEGIVWNQACMPKFIDLNSDNIDDMICQGVRYVNTNEIERDRWENHSPEHQRITPFANPSDWTWEWNMGQTYYILDEESNVLDEGHIFNKTRSDFSNEFKRGGYKIKTVGYRFQNDSTSQTQIATEIAAQELMDEILEEVDDKVSLPVIKEKTAAEIAAQELMDEILEELEAESSQ
jgi:hypothetical protein